MDGGDFGYPFCGGYAASNNGGDGSGGCRWGGDGGANYSGNANGYFTTTVALEAPGLVQQQQQTYQNLQDHNPFIKLHYQQQVTQQSAMGWPHGGGAVVPNPSFIPAPTIGGGEWGLMLYSFITQ